MGALTLVLGGASSGKSAFAEQLAASSGGPVTYIATGEASDPEMAAKIAKHVARRPSHWSTVEAKEDLAGSVIGESRAGNTIIIDSLTLHVARVGDEGSADLGAEGLLHALRAAPGNCIMVSDEVGMGLVPDSAAGRRFRDSLGRLNQAVADLADSVYLVVSGQPLAVKSEKGAR